MLRLLKFFRVKNFSTPVTKHPFFVSIKSEKAQIMSNQKQKTMRKALTFALLALMAITAHAQHFDWVKSYSGQEPPGRFWNYIVSSATDSHGNLYVAGQFANGASIDGQDLLPFTPNGGNTSNANSCIVKISPDGEILWKKHCTAIMVHPQEFMRYNS